MIRKLTIQKGGLLIMIGMLWWGEDVEWQRVPDTSPSSLDCQSSRPFNPSSSFQFARKRLRTDSVLWFWLQRCHTFQKRMTGSQMSLTHSGISERQKQTWLNFQNLVSFLFLFCYSEQLRVARKSHCKKYILTRKGVQQPDCCHFCLFLYIIPCFHVWASRRWFQWQFQPIRGQSVGGTRQIKIIIKKHFSVSFGKHQKTSKDRSDNNKRDNFQAHAGDKHIISFTLSSIYLAPHF